MADDPIIGDPKNAKAYNDAISEIVKNNQRMSQSIVPLNEHMDKFPDRLNRAAAEAEGFNAKLAELWTSTKKWADANLGATRSLDQLKRIGDKAVGTFQELTSITNIYDRRLKILRNSQELYTKSLLYHTGAQEQASAGLTKTLKIVEKEYAVANDVMKKFHISSKEGKEIYKAATKHFLTQIQAYKDSKSVIEGLTVDVATLGRRMGIDAPQYMQYLDQRMKSTNMTLNEARQETMLVGKAWDGYIKELNKTPAALRGAQLSAQSFMATIKAASEEFKFGAFNAGAFAAALAPLNVKAKQIGLNVAEIEDMNRGFVKTLGNLQDVQLKNIFGVQSAQEMLNRLDEFAEKGDENIKRRLSYVKKGLAEGGTEIQAMREVLQAAKGSPRLMAMVIERFQLMPNAIRKELVPLFADMQKNPLAARLIAESLGPDSPIADNFKKFAEGDVDQAAQANEYRAKQLKLSMSAQTPQDNAYASIMAIDETISGVVNWMKDHWGISLLAGIAPIALLAARSYIQIRQLRGIDRNITASTARLVAAIQTSGIGGGGGLGGAPSRTHAPGQRPSTGGRWSTRAAAVAPMVPSAVQAAPGGWRSVPRTTAPPSAPAPSGPGAGGKALGALGVLESFAAGYSFGSTTVDPWLGKQLAHKDKNKEAALRRRMGKDVTLSRRMAEDPGLMGAFSPVLFGAAKAYNWGKGGPSGKKRAQIIKEMDAQRRNRRAALTKEEVEIYDQLKKRKKLGESLTAEQEKLLKLMKRDVELRHKSSKLAEVEAKATQVEAVREGASEIDLSKLRRVKDPAERAKLFAREIIARKGTLQWQAGGAQAFEKAITEEGPAGAQMRAMMEQAGVSKTGVMKSVSGELRAAYIRQAALKGKEQLPPELRGVVTDEQIAAYNQMIKRQKAAGLQTDTVVASAAIAAGKREGTGQEFKIKIESGAPGEEGMAQEGKLNTVNQTMEYDLPATKLALSLGNLLKGLKQTESDMTPPSNASKE